MPSCCPPDALHVRARPVPRPRRSFDLHASPHYPPLRRAARLSWAVALAAAGRVELEKGEARLRACLAILQKHTRVLAALAAVKDVQARE